MRPVPVGQQQRLAQRVQDDARVRPGGRRAGVGAAAALAGLDHGLDEVLGEGDERDLQVQLGAAVLRPG
jgi:hypothetical protein